MRKYTRIIGLVLSLWMGGHSLWAEELPDLVSAVSVSVVNVQTVKWVKNSNLKAYLSTLSNPRENQMEQFQSSLGSGFVVASTRQGVAADGRSRVRQVLILTNAHVIEGAQGVEVVTALGPTRYKAAVVAQDPQTDIAVLKATLPAQVKALRLGDSAHLQVGESVFAIGNPFGLGHTVTRGILSAKDRSLGVGRADRYLQTDAAINFGNSGGPLFNMKGEVIGINTLIRADAQGIGFAIPSDTVKRLLPVLENEGKVERSWLGVVAANESTALREQFHIQGPTYEGVVVTHLVKSGPAHKIQIEEGDLLTALGTQGQKWPVKSVAALRDLLESLPPGTEVELKLRRGNRHFEGKMALERRPSSERLPEGYEYY